MKTLRNVTLALSLVAALAQPFAARAEAKAKAYPLTTCVVSGEKLDAMGDPFVFTHEGQEIKLCCKSCKKKFDKDPATYLKKLKESPAKK